MFQTKIVEKIKKNFYSINFLPQKSYRLWDNVEKCYRVGQATDDNIIRCMRFACWIILATDTCSEYVILIAFPLQQWLQECISMLRLYEHCLSCFFPTLPKLECASQLKTPFQIIKFHEHPFSIFFMGTDR